MTDPLHDPERYVGLYKKFNVQRTDGRSSEGEKHHRCAYFVIDLTHDPYAPAALRAYADACEATHPRLAADLRIRARQLETIAYRGEMRG